MKIQFMDPHGCCIHYLHGPCDELQANAVCVLNNFYVGQDNSYSTKKGYNCTSQLCLKSKLFSS